MSWVAFVLYCFLDEFLKNLYKYIIHIPIVSITVQWLSCCIAKFFARFLLLRKFELQNF